ncbi:UDP-Glycosyltransferase superfamily protein [Perilla frutescens var. hirtella]|uniref:Glycosyltransferase n=1 Tax=Perilla frutescens var. hirtella TaxID=608512 RepID=A0AAD4JG52_PERFH|nr:UDP-Glycosyltransferase superfamily protein [Perilla frutescens var. hirtella]
MTCSINEAAKKIHIFMVSFPGQGHINPLLRLGRRLADSGFFISICMPETAGANIRKTNSITDVDEPTPCGRGAIRFDFFDDGGDDGDLEAYVARLELAGREKLPQMIKKQEELGRPVSCLINNPFIPWVCDVADNLGIPCAMLWVQSAACFAAYYHYFHNLVPFPTEEKHDVDVKLPCMPVLKHNEIPSFLHPSTPYPFLREAILGQFANLSKTFCVLMDTFQELEHEIVEYMESATCRPIKTIGPLFKQHGGAPESTALRADFYAAESCVEWLDSKPPRTVVYISFGSVVHLKQEQVDEIAHGLLLSEVSFLWVLREPPLPEGFVEEVGERGKIVQWSPQEEVLAHTSTACFVTHCGWNSTAEAVASGVPVAAFPQWGDQVTNAKFMVDVYGVGIRMCRGVDEGGVVPRDEVARVLTAAVSGPRAAEIRENALKWRKSAEAALAEGGSSFKNMQHFANELARISGH